MAKRGRPPTCECGTCPKCRRNIRNKARYQAKTAEQRRASIAGRDPERVRDTDRRRSARPSRRAANIESGNRWNRKNPEKRKAGDKLRYAIRRGRIQRGPCEICGTTERIHAHHDDYSRPLDVRWLCASHHKRLHVAQSSSPEAARDQSSASGSLGAP